MWAQTIAKTMGFSGRVSGGSEESLGPIGLLARNDKRGGCKPSPILLQKGEKPLEDNRERRVEIPFGTICICLRKLEENVRGVSWETGRKSTIGGENGLIGISAEKESQDAKPGEREEDKTLCGEQGKRMGPIKGPRKILQGWPRKWIGRRGGAEWIYPNCRGTGKLSSFAEGSGDGWGVARSDKILAAPNLRKPKPAIFKKMTTWVWCGKLIGNRSYSAGERKVRAGGQTNKRGVLMWDWTWPAKKGAEQKKWKTTGLCQNKS